MPGRYEDTCAQAGELLEHLASLFPRTSQRHGSVFPCSRFAVREANQHLEQRMDKYKWHVNQLDVVNVNKRRPRNMHAYSCIAKDLEDSIMGMSILEEVCATGDAFLKNKSALKMLQNDLSQHERELDPLILAESHTNCTRTLQKVVS